jgi:hypothetical protein
MWIPSFVITSSAWLGYALSMRKVVAVVSGAAIARDLRARILAEGTSECLSLLVFGSFYIGLLLTLAFVFTAFRALHHGQRTKMGPLVIVVACAGFLLVVVTLPGAAFLAARLGGSGVPLFFAGPTLLATVLAGAFVAAAMGGDSEPSAYAAPASDGWTTLVMASVALVAWIGRGFVSSWSTVFSATSGESVDPSQSARILAEGAAETRAIWSAGAALLVPIAAYLVAPLLARPSAAARGFAGAWASLLLGAFMAVVLGVLPPLAVGSAKARIDAAVAIPWPSEIESVMIDRDEELGSVEGELLFYGKGRAWIAGAPEPSAALSPAECAALVRRAGAHAGGAIALGADAAAPVKALVCFARAVAETSPVREDPFNPGRGPKTPIVFMVRVRAGPEPTSAVVTSGLRPAAIALGPSDVPNGTARLRLARGGAWRYHTGHTDAEQSGTGRPPVPAGTQVLVTFDPDLTAREVLPILAGLRATVIFGAADPASFDPPPPGKLHARVEVDSADGIDLAATQAALDARRPALEQCEVAAARVLPPARFTVLTDGTLRADGRPPSADLLATCVRVALLGAALPKPKRTARVVVTVQFGR